MRLIKLIEWGLEIHFLELLCMVISGWDNEKIISFSASSFAIAHTFRGDVNKFNDTQIKNFINTNAC